jgi:hypothetical protein
MVARKQSVLSISFLTSFEQYDFESDKGKEEEGSEQVEEERKYPAPSLEPLLEDQFHESSRNIVQ